RKETEARVAETREDLERLQDVRDEVEKQIRHLQRQAASARRYQALKEQERRLTAELLALRLRDLDSGAQVHDAAVRERELVMQGALAEQRAAKSAIEKQRAAHTAHSERLSVVQGRYYEVGAEISRLEQSIEHARELRERQRADLAQAHTTLGDLGAHLERDERELEALRSEVAHLTPAFEAAQHAEQRAGAALEASEQALQDWQQRWETHARAVSEADQTAQVEGARIERTALEALQAAALSDHAGAAGEWLRGAGLAARPRLAAALEVESGWERAVETVLGDYLEAVCVERLEEVSGALGELATGQVTLVESGGAAPAGLEATLAAHVTGPAAVSARLAAVATAESLGDALRARAALAAGRSLVTREGEWVGRDWLRVSRGAEPRAGVLGREHRLKGLRAAATAADAQLAQAE